MKRIPCSPYQPIAEQSGAEQSGAEQSRAERSRAERSRAEQKSMETKRVNMFESGILLKSRRSPRFARTTVTFPQSLANMNSSNSTSVSRIKAGLIAMSCMGLCAVISFAPAHSQGKGRSQVRASSAKSNTSAKTSTSAQEWGFLDPKNEGLYARLTAGTASSFQLINNSGHH